MHLADAHTYAFEKSGLQKCDNMEVKAEILEEKVLGMFREHACNPEKLKDYMDIFKHRGRVVQERLERRLRDIDAKTGKLGVAKKRLLELYASGELERDAYATKGFEYDNELNKLAGERAEIVKRIPLLFQKDVIDRSIARYIMSSGIYTRLYGKQLQDAYVRFMLDP